MIDGQQDLSRIIRRIILMQRPVMHRQHVNVRSAPLIMAGEDRVERRNTACTSLLGTAQECGILALLLVSLHPLHKEAELN